MESIVDHSQEHGKISILSANEENSAKRKSSGVIFEKKILCTFKLLKYVVYITHLDTAMIPPFTVPIMDIATNNGIIQAITPNVVSANVYLKM